MLTCPMPERKLLLPPFKWEWLLLSLCWSVNNTLVCKVSLIGIEYTETLIHDLSVTLECLEAVSAVCVALTVDFKIFWLLTKNMHWSSVVIFPSDERQEKGQELETEGKACEEFGLGFWASGKWCCFYWSVHLCCSGGHSNNYLSIVCYFSL